MTVYDACRHIRERMPEATTPAKGAKGEHARTHTPRTYSVLLVLVRIEPWLLAVWCPSTRIYISLISCKMFPPLALQEDVLELTMF